MLALKDIHVYYGNIAAVKGLSVTVDQGEIVTLLGSNGAGKSTTLRTISGLLTPRKGAVMFEGSRFDGVAAHDIVALGIAQSPEGRRIFPRMTVSENLDLGAYLRKDKAGDRRRPGAHARAVPAAARADHPEGRHHVRRRAADARRRSGPDGPAEAAAARRAVDGSGAGAGRSDLRHHRRRSANRAPRCCSSSRTRWPRCGWPTGPTCSSPGPSSSPARPRSCAKDPEIVKAYLGG